MDKSAEAIYNQIIGNSDILALLGDSPPFFDEKGEKAKANSIVPAGKATAKTAKPFITIQQGVDDKLGKKLRRSSFYLRVYNDKNKAYVTINQIAEMLILLLDQTYFTIDNYVNVRTVYDSSLAEAEDQGMDLNFRELRFMIYML